MIVSTFQRLTRLVMIGDDKNKRLIMMIIINDNNNKENFIY